MVFLYLMLLVAAILIYNFLTVIQRLLYRIRIINLLESVRTKEDLLYFRYKDFVNIVAEVFKRKGYSVKTTDQCGEEANGLVLNNKLFVEVWKHSMHHVVEVEAAMKLVKCMQSNAIHRGMLMTLGDFKPGVRKFCYKNVIECINGEQLLEMCKEVQRRNQILDPAAHKHA